MTRSEILAAAESAICGDREKDYGDPKENFEMVAGLWSWYLGYKIDPAEVPAMMILLKIARDATGAGSDDNWIDIAGYAALAAEVTG